MRGNFIKVYSVPEKGRFDIHASFFGFALGISFPCDQYHTLGDGDDFKQDYVTICGAEEVVAQKLADNYMTAYHNVKPSVQDEYSVHNFLTEVLMRVSGTIVENYKKV
jgi:hypothetical protein